MSEAPITEDQLIRALSALARICAGRPERSSFATSLVLQVLRPFQARAAGVGIIDASGHLDMRTMYGFPAGALRDGPRYPLTDEYPLPDAVRRGEIISLPLPELVEKYPVMGTLGLQGRYMIFLPLLFRGATIGGMALELDVSPHCDSCGPFWSAVADLVSATLSSEEMTPTRERGRRSGPLSPRQHQILQHMQQGRTNSQIARAMNFGTSTIGHDIMRIFDVLGAESRREAVEAAERAGILAPRSPEGESEGS
jgi:DNA-binding CsgD family transcriptional regulator